MICSWEGDIEGIAVNQTGLITYVSGPDCDQSKRR